jgi:hypothetical protein
MGKPEDFGSNADGTRNEEYCHYCFQNGKFTTPDITMEQMIEMLVGMAAKMGMTEAQARQMAETFIPMLKRWKN